MTKQELIEFEESVAEAFKAKKIKCPIHLSSGNEEQLMNIFEHILSRDYVFSTHRNHFHYLLHTNDKEGLMQKILAGDSMHTCSPEHNFYSSSIVAGCVAIACGVALALKMKGSNSKVWCFISDGALDEGWTSEAIKYASSRDLPVTYVIEDNDRSVCSSIKQRWGDSAIRNKILHYSYECGYPHAGVGEFIDLDTIS